MKYIGGIFILSCIVIVILIRLFYNQKSINTQLSIVNEQITNKQANLFAHEFYRNYEINLNGLIIEPSLKVLEHDGSWIAIRNIITSNKLVLFFSEYQCNECIDSQISILNEKVSSIGKDNILILIKSFNSRYVSQFRIMKNLPYQIFKIDKAMEDLLSDADAPCYFIIEAETFRINSTFIPQKEFPELTEKYLKEIAQKYYRQK